jgi:hypothetical protein
VTFVIRHPIAAICICAAITVFAATGLAKLEFDDGLTDAFRSDYLAFRQYEDQQRLFSESGARIAVHLSSDDFAEPEDFLVAHEFVRELGFVKSVSARTSIFGLRYRADSAGEAKPLFSADQTSREAIQAALAEASRHPLNGNRLITRDLKNILVVIGLDDDTQNAVAAALDDIEALARTSFADTGIDYALAGIPVLRARVIEDIIHDQTVMNAAGAIIGFVLCLIMFRRLLPALTAGLPAIIALVWTLGFLGHSGIGINTLTNALPVLIMVLAFSDSMHLTHEKLLGDRRGLESEEAIANALRVAGPPCFMTSLTTGLAFASLLISGSQLVRSLAVAGMVSVAITFAAVILTNPLLELGAGRLPGQRNGRDAPVAPLMFPNKLWSVLLERILHKPTSVCVAGAMILLVAAALHSQIEPRFSLLENVNESAPELRRHRTVERLFSPLSTIDVVLGAASLSGAYSKPTLGRLGEVHDALARHFGDDRVVSLWSAAKWLDPEAPAEAGEQIRRLMEAGMQAGGNPFVSADGLAYRIAVLTPELPSNEALALADEIRSVAITALADWPSKPEAGGFMTMAASASTIMINQLNYSFLVAAAVSGIVVGLWCRRVWVGVVALFVNILPISLAGAWLSASGSGLQFASGLALTIAFGIAVDDTLHVLNRVRPRLLAGKPLTLGDLRAAFTEITPVLLATTVILVGGIGSALLSAIPTINLFALISMGVLVAAFVADVVLLPATLSLLLRTPAG